MRLAFIGRRIGDASASNPASGNFKRKPDSDVLESLSHGNFIVHEEFRGVVVLKSANEPQWNVGGLRKIEYRLLPPDDAK